LARDFTVYVVNRKRGLQPGESMSDIAGHLASAIEHDLGQPVFLEGASTGGSVALQLAADRPDLVWRLVVVAAAYRLGPRGRELQAEMARLIRAGEPRDAWASAMTTMLPGPLRGPARPLSRLAVGPMVPADPTDVLVTLDAEDAFDVEAGLPRVTAPTLVIGGGNDHFYTQGLYRVATSGHTSATVSSWSFAARSPRSRPPGSSCRRLPAAHPGPGRQSRGDPRTPPRRAHGIPQGRGRVLLSGIAPEPLTHALVMAIM
jgi:pimeloyl-ACP methyl ester carboxylesterase